MEKPKVELKLYNFVNSSNTRQLSRIYNFCNNNTKKNSSMEAILACIFNIKTQNVLYYNTNFINAPNGVCVWQGIAKYKNKLLIVGTSLPGPNSGQGVVYFGDITCVGGITYTLSVPGAEYTSVYGPRYDPTTELFTFVGSYTLENDTTIYAFLFRGELNDLANPAKYVFQMNFNPTLYTTSFTHSTDGMFAVGNSGSVEATDTYSWLYNITTETYTPISFPNSKTTTTYGIIKNANGSYTIVGGYSSSKEVKISDIYIENGLIIPFQDAFVADFVYDGNTITFLNFTTIQYLNNYLTHFEGISATNNPNIYTISADVLGVNNNTTGFFVMIARIENKFVAYNWTSIDYGKSIHAKGLTTSNSVINNNIVGLFVDTNGNNVAFQSTIIL